MCRSVLFVVSLALLLATQSFKSSAQTRVVQADDLVKQARAALGGEARLRRVQSLSATGQFRRVFPDRERTGALELNWLSPDKFRQVETMGLAGDVQISLTSVLDGARAWKESTVDTGSLPITVTQPAGHAKPLMGNEQRQLRASFARYLPALLLAAATPGRFNDAGTAEVNGAPARVLDVRTAAGFTAQLYLDAKTYLPLMLSYRGRPPVIALGAQGGAELDGAQETELRVRYADYRAVGGLLWPHRITTEADGRLLEELELKLYKLNPEEINPQSFGRE